MSLLAHIKDAFQAAAATAANEWHTHIEPWLANFLKTTVKAEIDAILPIATEEVSKVVPAAIAAIQSGNVQGFLDAQWDAANATADKIAKTAETVALTSIATATSTLLVSHSDVVAATAAAKTAP